MGFEGCGASEWAQWALGESDAGVGEVSLAGFNGADHGLTAGSSSGKTQLKFAWHLEEEVRNK